MRKPRYFEAESRHERWLISYVDIVTILLILFAALAAQAVQRGQAPLHAAEAPKAVAAKPPAADNQIPPALETARERLQKQGVELQLEKRGLVISLPQAVLFEPGDDRVSDAALPVVSRIAEVLRDMPNRVLLVGHADASPIHTRRFRSNWDLSAARSLRLLELLTSRYEIPEDRLSTAGQGSYNPLGRNDTEDGRAANRRVEVIILNDEPASSASDGIVPLRPIVPEGPAR